MATSRRKQSSRKQTRAAIYLRVSSEEQVEGYSLDAQQRALEGYCREQGYDLVQQYRDEGRSARTDNIAKRPAFKQMLEDAEAGAFDVLVVHKLDRFARNVRVLFESLDRLEQVDVGFVSFSENMDFSTPMGRMTLSMMGGFAQFFSDNLSAETKKGKTERKRQGMYNGLLPFGVMKGDDALPVANPVTHPGLLLAFTLAAAGKTDREVAQALNEAGYRTTGNRGSNPFTKDTVRPMLQNRFYLGELPDGEGGWLPGKHDALIEASLFAQAEQGRLRNSSRPRRVSTERRSPWALSGLAVCACGAAMTASGRADARQRVQCSRRVQTGACDAPSFFTDIVEEQIAAFLRRFAVSERERQMLVKAWQEQQERSDTRGQERARIQRKLERLRDTYLEGDLDQGEYRKRKAALTEDLAMLPAGNADASMQQVGEHLAGFLADIPSAWEVATPEEKNRIARQLFNAVTIENRTAVEVTPRPDLLPFFVSVSELNTYGRKRRDSNPRSQP